MALRDTPSILIQSCSDVLQQTVFNDIHANCRPSELVIHSTHALHTLSSAVLGGGMGMYHTLVNLKVDKNYHHPDPTLDAKNRVEALGYAPEASVALMTAAILSDGAIGIRNGESANPEPGILVIATVGLSNAAHVLDGDMSRQSRQRPGTINLMCVFDAVLTDAAFAGAMITATEAKCAALHTLGVKSASGHIATGTTSDAMVVAARPSTTCTASNRSNASTVQLPPIEYMGLATTTGQAFAETVYYAILAAGKRNIERMAIAKPKHDHKEAASP